MLRFNMAIDNIRKGERGLTVAEVLIAMTITGIVAVALLSGMIV